jgi:hypothetical protein
MNRQRASQSMRPESARALTGHRRRCDDGKTFAGSNDQFKVWADRKPIATAGIVRQFSPIRRDVGRL